MSYSRINAVIARFPRSCRPGRGRRALGALVVAIAACAASPAAVHAADDPKVVVTIKPLHAIVAAVMEGAGTPELLLEGVQSPHSFALKPSQAQALNAAHFVFLADKDLEVPIARIAGSLPKSVRVVPLIESPGVSRLEIRTGVAFEPHSHGDGEAHAHSDHKHSDHKHSHDKHAHGKHSHDKHSHDKHSHGKKEHSHSHAHDHGHDHAHTGGDPHFWLDPRNARAAAAHVATLLAERYPDKAEVFSQNAGRFDAELAKLEETLMGELSAAKDAGFLVFHDAFQYFERRFGLTAVGSITANPEVLPGARRLSELRTRVRDSGAVCVFSEPQFQTRVIETVIEGTGVRRGVIDPLGADMTAGPGQYASLLQSVAGSLKSCLVQ